jgi:hypothetical protein
MNTSNLNTCPEDLPPSTDLDEVVGTDVAAANDEPETTLLLDKFIVETDFLAIIEGNFQEIYPHLLEDTEYTPEDLCGEAFWDGLSELGQRLALLCLKHLAAQDDVPLFEERCENCGTAHFGIF